VPIQLRLREAEEKRAAQIAGELEKLLPGRFAELQESRRAALSDDQRKAVDTPPMDRTDAQQQAAAAAEAAMRVTWKMVARQAPAAVRPRAEELAREHTEATERAEMIDRYRDIVNFDVWRATCESEVTEACLRARERTWTADREFEAARLQAAKGAYEEAFAAWREVLDASKVLREDSITADDLAEIVGRYRKLLEQLDEPFPSPFVLQDVLDRTAPPT
jgi:tetratricopeptide (TPR) repeat protein